MKGAVLKKITRNIRDYGPAVFIRKLFSSGLKPIFEVRTYQIYAVDLQKLAVRGTQYPDNLIFRFITSDETALIKQIEEMEEWLDGKVAGKLGKGQKCLVALKGDKVVGFNLISFDVFRLPVVRLAKPLRPSECSSEQITIRPEFRGQGLGAELRNVFFSRMREAGYRKIYGGTEATNTANKALTRKVGFKLFAEIGRAHV